MRWVVQLSTLRGEVVAVTHVTERSEKTARTIEVKPEEKGIT